MPVEHQGGSSQQADGCPIRACQHDCSWHMSVGTHVHSAKTKTGEEGKENLSTLLWETPSFSSWKKEGEKCFAGSQLKRHFQKYWGNASNSTRSKGR